MTERSCEFVWWPSEGLIRCDFSIQPACYWLSGGNPKFNRHLGNTRPGHCTTVRLRRARGTWRRAVAVAQVLRAVIFRLARCDTIKDHDVFASLVRSANVGLKESALMTGMHLPKPIQHLTSEANVDSCRRLVNTLANCAPSSLFFH